MENNIIKYMEKRAVKIDEAINEYLNNRTSERYLVKLLGRSGYEYDNEAILKSVIEPANYLFKLGGKRWRPILMLEIIEALGKDSNNFIEFSIIPEIVHNATILHDDIEDDSTMRRGSETVHIKYGVDVALNLGDFMYYFPIVALLDSKKIPEEKKMMMLSIYQRDMLKVSLGQAIDIAWHRHMVDPENISEKKYMQMAYSKTGVLSGMAAKLGGVLGDADEKTIDALGRFGSTIGVAFQLEDDLLNVTKSELSRKKGGVGDDIKEGKISILVIHTLSSANEKDRKKFLEILKAHTSDPEKINEAIEIIEKYGAEEYVRELKQQLINDAWNRLEKLLPESDAKLRLKQISDFLINRSV